MNASILNPDFRLLVMTQHKSPHNTINGAIPNIFMKGSQLIIQEGKNAD
jgi:hypothetical protein